LISATGESLISIEPETSQPADSRSLGAYCSGSRLNVTLLSD